MSREGVRVEKERVGGASREKVSRERERERERERVEESVRVEKERVENGCKWRKSE